MKPRRWIVVDTRYTREESLTGTCDRYLGPNWWAPTIADAGTFDSYDAAAAQRAAFIRQVVGEQVARFAVPGRLVIRRVRPAGAKRDTTAALRAELDGLRSTDAECSAALALAEQRAAGWAASYQSATDREARVRVTLGAVQGEATDEVVKRVVAERDDAVRDLAEVRQQLAALYDTLAAAKAAWART